MRFRNTLGGLTNVVSTFTAPGRASTGNTTMAKRWAIVRPLAVALRVITHVPSVGLDQPVIGADGVVNAASAQSEAHA